MTILQTRKLAATRDRVCNDCGGKGGTNVKSCTGCKGRGVKIQTIQVWAREEENWRKIMTILFFSDGPRYGAAEPGCVRGVRRERRDHSSKQQVRISSIIVIVISSIVIISIVIASIVITISNIGTIVIIISDQLI